ncbi:hypothetical protein B0H17DRAFT_1152409 [Mycena rosella]|uniref:Uncharacterized protein n=1 Tax=Mycena rosella TaxID=1033263 RepID=A0AAD7BDZ9_MYCRO|nr:hypothetical protein B0H17DRAFT_1152409 [Mycena rosella]
MILKIISPIVPAAPAIISWQCQSGIDIIGVTGGNAEHVGRTTPSDSVCASGQQDSRVVCPTAVEAKKKDPHPTVEAVTDDEDVTPLRRSTVPSKATSRCSGSSPEFVHSVIPPSPQLTNKKLYGVYKKYENADERVRQQRREGKQRHKHADSIESAEMRIVAARSLAKRPEVSDAGSNPCPNNWDDINLHLAADALARKRGENKSNSVYQRRVAAWKQKHNERQLCAGREADNLAVEEELRAHEVLESEDFALEAKQHRPIRGEKSSRTMCTRSTCLMQRDLKRGVPILSRRRGP